MATFADDTSIKAVGGDVIDATEKLKRAADEMNIWTRQWLIKLNKDKSIHVTFTNKRCHHIPIIMNGKTIPHSQTAKNLGITLDAKLRWKVYIKKKRDELGLKYTCTGLWVVVRPCPHTTSWCSTNRHLSLCHGIHKTEQHSHDT